MISLSYNKKIKLKVFISDYSFIGITLIVFGGLYIVDCWFIQYFVLYLNLNIISCIFLYISYYFTIDKYFLFFYFVFKIHL